MIDEWFERGLEEGATHLMVVCDTFDHDDYPVFIYPDDSVTDVVKLYQSKEMQRVMEVYNLSMPKKQQLDEHRSWNF